MAKVLTLGVVVESRPGILSQIIVALSKQGIRVLKHQVQEREDGNSLFTLFVEGAKRIDQSVADAIAGVKGCLDVLTDPSKADAAAPKNQDPVAQPAPIPEDDEEVARSLLKVYPDVRGMLLQIANSTPEHQRDDRLHSLGSVVGKVVYKKKYALGLPVKMPAALKRIVVPELKAFGKAAVNGEVLAVAGNQLCGSSEAKSVCSFVHGLIDGLVVANPHSEDADVARVACIAHGDDSCRFEVID